MKLFILKLFIFLLPILLLCYPLDLIISGLFKKGLIAEGETVVWDDIYTNNIPDSCFVLGSSRAWLQFNPKTFLEIAHVGTYNLGLDGQTFSLQKMRYDETVKYNNKPKYLVLSVESTTFEKRDYLYNKEQFYPFMLWNDDIESLVGYYKGFGKFDFKLPLVRYIGGSTWLIRAFSAPFVSNCIQREKGYLARDEKWNNDFKKAQLLGNIFAKINTETVSLFEKFVLEAKQNEIKLAIVYSPEYIEGQYLIQNRDSVIRIFREISSKYEVPFYDYSNDSLSMDKKYFYNSQHLNKTGSLKFSKDLVERLCKDDFFTVSQ